MGTCCTRRRRRCRRCRRRPHSALKAGIEEHGLQHPIEVQNGTRYLLNGRGRYRACRELRIPLKIKEIDIPDDEVAVYTGAEAAKRGLTPSQRAIIAMGLLPEFERRAAERRDGGVKVRQVEKGKAADLAAGRIPGLVRSSRSARSVSRGPGSAEHAPGAPSRPIR
jgi:ParB-like chromosome segregation protein Spo0J